MLSMKAKYAIKALIVLAQKNSLMLQTRIIADESGTPQKFLEAILVDLKNHGIVASKRGALGGYFLSRSAENITLGEVIRIMDGPLAMIRCASITAYQKCDDCTDEESCAIRNVMKDVRGAISSILDKKTIKDML